ncbi:uncharacterized protein [Drosophila bipectinata]|uniref:uncharacterized protein n=1 Tax=Drosophila bipectinata TaxID=42026 RepID=UPI0038B343F0
MSWEYREVKQEVDSDDSEEIGFYHTTTQLESPTMNPEIIQALITNAVSSLIVQAPQVEVYERVTPDPTIECGVKLDIVKSLPTFSGSHDEYVSWRQAALDAYEVLKRYKGSETHYEAVVIIKNKICGNARSLLTSHNNVLKFDAILDRLDCTYADKTSLRVLRQNLEMVRQGDADLMTYYDEVERKLTLVTNKIVMSHTMDTATFLNKEVRDDALHAFIAGPAQPKDLPSAIALAREAENSIERSAFAASYAKAIEDKAPFYEGNRRNNKGQGRQWKAEDKNRHFIPRQGQGKSHEDNLFPKCEDSETMHQNKVQPMEVDPSTAKERSRLPFVERQLASRTLKILIDTGAAKNYVKPVKELRNVMPVKTPFTVSSIYGISDVKNKCKLRIFGLYPYPMGAADFVNNEIKELLINGIIRPSRSSYNSPAWVVDKKGTDDNGIRKKRLVIDFKKLTEQTIADRYPMPSIPMILANLGKAKYFTTLDLRSGYHQIYLAEKDREKTSFSVNGGKYEFCRLPFGLKYVGSIFQRAIDDVLREEIGKICYVYVDDVIIFSENETEHVKHINIVLKRLIDANMKLEIAYAEHNRAHRAAQENAKQILRDYYFPNMSKLASEVFANCKVCNKAKYDRHPKRQETIYCDNEASFNSETITSLLKNQYSIDVINAPPLHSSSNGQVERFHSTLAEIARSSKTTRRLEVHQGFGSPRESPSASHYAAWSCSNNTAGANERHPAYDSPSTNWLSPRTVSNLRGE